MGADVLVPMQAWRIYDALQADRRITFLDEQTGFSNYWRQVGNQITGGVNVWTDSYLAAFASFTQTTIVTFDRRFKTIGNCSMLLLPA